MRPGVDSEPTPLFTGEYREISPAVSPDGRWIAYASDETGRYEIYVRPFPDVSESRVLVSINGGWNPQWAHSGGEIFFQGPANEMMVVAVDTDGAFSANTPNLLFEADPAWYFANLGGTIYDLHPDDQRFLMATTRPAEGGSDDDTMPATVLVNNFFEELRRVVPE